MKVLSAREMFKKEEATHNISCWMGEQVIYRYGKINDYIAYKLINKNKGIGSNARFDVDILFQLGDANFKYTKYRFWDEQEPAGGRIVGKRYKSALEYIEEFIEKLKNIECLSEENVDKIYDEFYKQFNI